MAIKQKGSFLAEIGWNERGDLGNNTQGKNLQNSHLAVRIIPFTIILVVLSILLIPSVAAIQVAEGVCIETPGTGTMFSFGPGLSFDRIEVHFTYLVVDNTSISISPPIGSVLRCTILDVKNNYTKWSEKCSSATAETYHIIGGLLPDTAYLLKTNGSIAGEYTSDDLGKISFAYSGGYTNLDLLFEIEEKPPNTPPTANAGEDYICDEGTEIHFNASASSDPEGDTLQYRWDYENDGTWDTKWSVDSAATHIWTDEYSGIVCVEVTDGEYFANATASITILNVAPTATVSSDSPINEGIPITITVSATDPGTEDILTYSFDWDNNGSFEIEQPEHVAEYIFNDNGTCTVGVKVADDDGAEFATSIDVEILDTSPIADFYWKPEPVDEGMNVSFFDTSESFPDEIISWQWSGDVTGTEENATCLFADNGTFTAILIVEDDDGSISSIEKTVDVANVAPSFEAGDDVTIDEGDTVSRDISFTEPGDDTVAANIDYGEENPGIQLLCAVESPITIAHSYMDEGDGTYTVTITLNDEDGGITTDTFKVIVNNVAPIITSITPPVTPIQVNVPVEISATFTDPGADLHDATWDWGEELAVDETGIVDEDAKTVTGSHAYTTPGVYTVSLTIDDGDGGTDTMTCTEYVVVYDPDGGFVTGGGWIDSPVGAYTIDDTLTGKATFGFVSKYKKGATTPEGQTQFQFKAGDLNFHSDSYDFLVIAGSKAMYKGTGTINGAGEYGFMLSAIDEALNPSTDVDLFRIKIWDRVSETIVYDNMLGMDEDENPTTAIGGGSIVIHTK